MDIGRAQTELKKFVNAWKTCEDVVEALGTAAHLEQYTRQLDATKKKLISDIDNLESSLRQLDVEFKKQEIFYKDSTSNIKSVHDDASSDYSEKIRNYRDAYATELKEKEKKQSLMVERYSREITKLESQKSKAKQAANFALKELEELKTRLSNVG